jgi:hypothetical protein
MGVHTDRRDVGDHIVSEKDLVRGQAPPGGGNRLNAAHRPKQAGLDVRCTSLLLTPVLIVATLGVGWLGWSVFEWCHGRTPSYRRTGLRVVRRSDGRPIGLCRSIVREACLLVLVFPTILICALVAMAFVMGASAPDGFLRQARPAPWDVLTRTEVIDERGTARSKLKLGEDWPTDPSPVLLRRSGEKWRQN